MARRGKKVIGYVFAMWFFDEMHVNKIAVEERERRRGIAVQLMDRCLAFAKDNGIRTISLERQSDHPDGESAVVMVRELA